MMWLTPKLSVWTATVFSLLWMAGIPTVAIGQETDAGQKLMERFETIPSYRGSIDDLMRRAEAARQQELRRAAGERVIVFRNQKQLLERIDEEIRIFIDECRRNLGEAGSLKYGIQHIQDPDWLDKRRLKLIPLTSPVPGEKRCRVVFDAGFYQHVLQRGRQLKLSNETNRFPATLFAFGGLFAALCIGYGVIKVVNARRIQSENDYISASRISMV